jgi:hypothetical protein
MTKIDSVMLEKFSNLATAWLAPQGYTNLDVKLGSDAWHIASRAGITEICYGNTAKDLSGIPDCHDAHIKTALAQIFPNAVFKDKYRY